MFKRINQFINCIFRRLNDMKLSAIIITGLILISSLSAGLNYIINSRLLEDPEVLRIGILHSTTGPASPNGRYSDQAAYLFIRDFENNEGMLGGRRFKAFFYDTEGVPEKARENFSRLVEKDHVHVVIGSNTSDETRTLVFLADKYQTPFLAYTGPDEILNPVRKYLFSIAARQSSIIEKVLQLIFKQGLYKIAVIHTEDAYGLAGIESFREMGPKIGVSITDSVSFSLSPEISSELNYLDRKLSQIMSSDADAYVVWAVSSPGPALILKRAQALGMRKPIYISPENASYAFLREAGTAAEGVKTLDYAINVVDTLPNNDPRKLILRVFVSDYKDRWFQRPDFSSGFTFDAFLVLQESLRNLKGDLNKKTLREAIERVIMCGSTGCRQYSTSDHSGLSATSLVPVQNVNTKWTVFEKFALNENFGANFILPPGDISVGRDLVLNNCKPCHFGSNASETVLIERPAKSFQDIADDPASNNLSMTILLNYMNSSASHAGGMPYLSLSNYQVNSISAFILSLKSK
jgi:branched-chain amino acid transport system substrate-binding protein